MAPIDEEIKKLEMYRKKKENESRNIPSKVKVFKDNLQIWSSNLVHYLLPDKLETTIDPKREINKPRNLSNLAKSCRSQESKPTTILSEDELQNENVITSSVSKIDVVILLLKILLWLIVWKLFILIEFGAVFFICSCLAFIWVNLRSGPHKGGLSAYSVFNPNCEQLVGSFTAEKFEKELLHR